MRRLGITCVALGLGFGLAELAIRASGSAQHFYTAPAFQSSPRLTHWTYKPGFEGILLGPTWARFDEYGARIHGHADRDASREPVVAVFGDSVTMGQTVAADETYPAVLERRLAAAGINTFIHNFGVQGHSLEMIVAHVEDVQPALRADVVILAFIEDDLAPSRADNGVDRFGYLTKSRFLGGGYGGDLLRAAMRESHLALAIKAAYLQQKRRGTTATTEWRDAVRPEYLNRFRRAIERFEIVTRGSKRLVVSLQIEPHALSRSFAKVMATEFPTLPYVETHPFLAAIPPADLRGSVDKHPNASAHALFAAALYEPVRSSLATHPRGGA